MQTSLSGVRQRLMVVLAVTATLLGTFVVLSGARASADNGPSASCSGDDVANFPGAVYNDIVNALTFPDKMSKTIDLPEPIEPGTYSAEVVTYNGGDNRPGDVGQHQEILTMSLLDADGAVLATTKMTGDLEDGVLEATGVYDVGPIVLDAVATQVRADLGATEATSKHSVNPVCIGLTKVPTDVQPSTTLMPTTTTGNIKEPTTTSIPTTPTNIIRKPPATEPPVSILPQTTVPTEPTQPARTTPPAPTVTGTPRFTG